jgi:hypothetical protein
LQKKRFSSFNTLFNFILPLNNHFANLPKSGLKTEGFLAVLPLRVGRGRFGAASRVKMPCKSQVVV